jgi:hypothetical protein
LLQGDARDPYLSFSDTAVRLNSPQPLFDSGIGKDSVFPGADGPAIPAKRPRSMGGKMRTEPPDICTRPSRLRTIVYFTPPEAGIIAEALRKAAVDAGVIADESYLLLSTLEREWQGVRSRRFLEQHSGIPTQLRALQSLLFSQAEIIRHIRISKEVWIESRGGLDR